MTYEEAEIESLKVPWVLEQCETPNCWCACISTDLKYKEKGINFKQKYYVASSGSLRKEIAQYIVEIHNSKLAQDKINKEHSDAIHECMKNGSQR